MRMHAWMILSALGSKAGSPEELLEFWWEHSEEASKDDEEKLARMRQWAEEWNKTH